MIYILSGDDVLRPGLNIEWFGAGDNRVRAINICGRFDYGKEREHEINLARETVIARSRWEFRLTVGRCFAWGDMDSKWRIQWYSNVGPAEWDESTRKKKARP